MDQERGIQSRHKDRGAEQERLQYEGGGGRKITKYILLDYITMASHTVYADNSKSKPK